MSDKIKSNLELISKYRIYFGHRSVGTNIIKGIEKILTKSKDSKLDILNVDETEKLPETFFGHSLIGENGKPKTKCDDFSGMLAEKVGDSLDIAFFKFCFADFKQSINAEEEFDYYKKMYNELKQKYPHIKFVHLTVPLKSGSTGIKKIIKRMLNKEDWSDADNIIRNKFNNLLLSEYNKSDIFDIAKIQSTYPDGSRESFEKDGKIYYALINDYTTDGGHLNDKGGIILGEALINFLGDFINNNFSNSN